MSGKNFKLLRKGAKKYKYPYKLLKRAYKNIAKEKREWFLREARWDV